MNFFLQGIRICQYQLCILSKNYKIYTIPVCMFIFMWNALLPLREFIILAGVKATPYLLPFLFNDKFLCSLMFAGILLFFIDAPFYDKQQLFVIIRTGVTKWILGQVLYILCISIFYMCFLVMMSILILVPHITFDTNWNQIWITLAVTDAGYSLGIPFSVSTSIIYNYTPIYAMLLTFLLGFLICTFYGFCVWLLNLYFGKIISLVIVLASIVLVTRIKYLPSWVMYFVPSAWVDLSNLSQYASHRISITKAITILIVGILLLIIIIFIKTMRSDIAK